MIFEKSVYLYYRFRIKEVREKVKNFLWKFIGKFGSSVV